MDEALTMHGGHIADLHAQYSDRRWRNDGKRYRTDFAVDRCILRRIKSLSGFRHLLLCLPAKQIRQRHKAHSNNRCLVSVYATAYRRAGLIAGLVWSFVFRSLFDYCNAIAYNINLGQVIYTYISDASEVIALEDPCASSSIEVGLRTVQNTKVTTYKPT